MKKDERLTRRDFLRQTPVKVIGLGTALRMSMELGALVRAAAAEELVDPAAAPERTAALPEASKIRGYRPLGKTGFKLSDIGMGAAVDTAIIRYAFDCGINYFDTADSYYNGQGETALGSALKTVRDKCIVSTKHMVEQGWKRDTLFEKVNASLKRLGSDYVDLLFIQGVGDPALFRNEEIVTAYEDLKKQGKYRFLCFSTHDTDTVVPAAIECGLFSAAMLMYTPDQFDRMEEMHTRLYDAGIGIIAMKTLKGGEKANLPDKAQSGLTFAQSSIRWALQDKKISTVLISMRTFEHVEEYL